VYDPIKSALVLMDNTDSGYWFPVVEPTTHTGIEE